LISTINITNIKDIYSNEKYQSENFTKPKLHFSFTLSSLNPVILE